LCKNTNHRGFFNHTHTLTAAATTSRHKFPRADDDTASTSTETASLSRSGASTISSLSSTASTAENIGVVTLKETKTSLKLVNEDHVDKDPDGLEFVGAYLADCNTNDAAWLTVAPDPASFVMDVGVMIDDDWEEVGEEPNLTVVESNDNTSVAF